MTSHEIPAPADTHGFAIGDLVEAEDSDGPFQGTIDRWSDGTFHGYAIAVVVGPEGAVPEDWSDNGQEVSHVVVTGLTLLSRPAPAT